MSINSNKDNFRIFIDECNQNTLKEFLIAKKGEIINLTKENILNCLNIQELVINNIKDENILNFVTEYYKFEKKIISQRNKECKRSNERFETLTKQGNAIFFMINPETMKFTFSKGKGLKKLGLKENEAVGKNVADYYGNNEAVMNGIKQAAEGKERSGLLEVGRFNFDTNFTPVFDEDGSIIEIVGMAFDVSKHIALEKKLKEADVAKDKFFSIIAHDLKGPFGSIVSFLDILKSDFKELSIDEIEERFVLIDQLATRSYNLLVRLLEWARAQSKTQFNPEIFDIYHEVTDQIKLLQEIANSKNITLENRIINTTIKADKRMFNLIIRNLVSNAIKFAGNKGNSEKIVLSGEINGKELVISVQDNGIGMHPEQKDSLFQIDKIYSTKGTNNEVGTGLGLLLCKEFVEKHGGKIRVEQSEPGQGTTIQFSIPIRNYQ